MSLNLYDNGQSALIFQDPRKGNGWNGPQVKGYTVRKVALPMMSPTSAPTKAVPTPAPTKKEECPVTCEWVSKLGDGTLHSTDHIKVHHQQDMMDDAHWVGGRNTGVVGEQVGGVEPGSFINKIFHRCWHDNAGACSCQCAAWDYEDDNDDCNTDTECPTTCGQPETNIAGTRNVGCYFGADQMRDSQCLESSKPDTTCLKTCAATPAC